MEPNLENAHPYETTLLSSSGTGAAYATALAIRRNWGDSVRIIGCDSNPANLVTTSLFSDKFIQLPLNIDNSFKKKLHSILISEKVNTYIPFIDHEVYIGAALYEESFKDAQLKIQVKDSFTADLCDDKYKTYFFLSEANIKTPPCYLTDEPISNLEQLIIKPRRGFGSKIEKYDNTRSHRMTLNPERFILQPECERPELTVDVCYDNKSNFFNYVCRERIETKSGVCTKARLFLDPGIEKIAFEIASRLNLNAFCFQLMVYKQEYCVTDINARLGAGTAMSYSAGLDFFSAMLAILWDQDPSSFFRPLQKETFVTRQYSEFVMNK